MSWCVHCNKPTEIKPGLDAKCEREFNFSFWNQPEYLQIRQSKPCVCPKVSIEQETERLTKLFAESKT